MAVAYIAKVRILEQITTIFVYPDGFSGAVAYIAKVRILEQITTTWAEAQAEIELLLI